MLNKKIGILGGGQLGKMLIQAGSKWGLDIHILDASIDMPAAPLCRQFHIGDFKNYDDVYAFAKEMDIVTIEIESINTEALRALDDQGCQVYPQPEIIDIIKDKGLQKQFYVDNGLVSSSFRLIDNKEHLYQLVNTGQISVPFVLKLRKDGYDGRGVMIIREVNDLESAFDAPCLVEDLVDIKMEIAVISCRNPNGDIAVYDPVEMVFDPDANLLDYQIAPATISKELVKEAKKLATELTKKLEIVGLLAVEMFITDDNKILINEVAPRPHNSGHHTIEACITSQYEQHLRAILNLPLGDTTLTTNSVLVNLLGEVGKTGPVAYDGLNEVLDMPGVYPHLYGKKNTKPKRKMGHINVIGESMERIKEIASEVKKTLKSTI